MFINIKQIVYVACCSQSQDLLTQTRQQQKRKTQMASGFYGSASTQDAQYTELFTFRLECINGISCWNKLEQKNDNFNKPSITR